ncbi:kinesin-like protein KIF27 [Watersipora subatra]|uniref:kinesin-like protein KIF27 n=1 Tax=Watersipora subatra TaxID=2589382 RepID=UPI00355BD7C4
MIDDNVKVAVRVRPLLAKETVSGEQKCVKVLKDSKQVLVGKDRLFTFDHIISPLEKQDTLYERCIDSLVTSCLEGFNATVFAYGQTGSGKTYTIGGTSAATHTDEELGVIPRALQRLFLLIEVSFLRKSEGIEFQVSTSYLELYLEDLRDLLDVSTSSKDITIREDDQGNTVVSGMRAVPCKSVDEVLYCLQHGSAARQTGSTQMNEHSSRSHSVFTVTLGKCSSRSHSVAEETSQNITNDSLDVSSIPSQQYNYVCSKFHFVDLAGSERAHRTGNVGDRFKESITINTGLLALGNVISALGDPKKKSSHVPYRDSKITRLLKDSLGGNSKTLMICCISPASSDFDETLNALKYANRARNIKNKPVVNRDVQSIGMEEMQNEIQALKRELEIKDSLLREETNLSARTAIESQVALSLQDREDKIISLQRTSELYEALLRLAADTLTQIDSKESVKSSTKSAIQDWLRQWHNLRISTPLPPITNSGMTNEVKQEVAKYEEMLKNDEEIFAQKAKEIIELQNQNAQLLTEHHTIESELEAVRKRCVQLEEVLLEQQLALDQVGPHGDGLGESLENENIQLSSGRRAKSVPAHGARLQEPAARPVHTSPALFTIERYMQGFRARSQLLVERLDDEDEVLHQPFLTGNVELEERDNLTGLNDTGLTEKSPPKKSRSRTLSFGEVTIRETQADESGTLKDVRLSMDRHQKEIRQAKLKSQEFNSRLRDLTIAIRMKEQLIRQLVKNEKDSAVLVKQHKDKISAMEEEKIRTNRELQDLQKEFQRLEAKEKMEINSKRRLQGEYKKKIDSAKRRLTSIQTKQKETVKLASMSERTDEKINDLQLAVAKMRQQQEELQRKLKQEHDKKEKLERDMAKEQFRVRELEDITEQQQKVLKIKTEEMAAANRKLRKGNGVGQNNSIPGNKYSDDPKLLEQKLWLDAEMEKVLEQRKQMELLEKELRSRALIIAKKEEIMKEKGELEMKHLRASQQFHQTTARDLEALHKERDNIESERVALDQKLYGGGTLSNAEDRRLLELSEAIEALDAAIEFKSEIIAGKEAEIRRSQVLSQHEDNLTNRLKSLSIVEAQKLLSRYFTKVITLKENSREVDLHCQDLQLQLEDQSKLVLELEASLESQVREVDNRLTEQQQQYELEINSLLQKISEKENVEPNTQQFVKIQQLEKDLYYYKKTSRDLKKKLREVMVRAGEQAAGFSLDAHVEESGIEPLDHEHHNRHSPRPHSPTGTHLPPLVGAMSPATRTSYSSVDGQHVKISKKDLRPMSHEEINIRRSQLQSAHSTRTSADSLDG